MTDRPTYQQCLDAGMTATETAKARGVTISAVSRWAKRNGVMFSGQELTQSERMKRLQADPEFNPLAALTPEQRADYDTLKKAGYTREEALKAVGAA